LTNFEFLFRDFRDFRGSVFSTQSKTDLARRSGTIPAGWCQSMKNITLNPGGLIGALLAVALLAAGVLYWGNSAHGWLSRGLISVAFAGGVAGNWIWAGLFLQRFWAVAHQPEQEYLNQFKMLPANRVFRMSGVIRWLLYLTFLPLGACVILGGVAVVFDSQIKNKLIAVPVSFLGGTVMLVASFWAFRSKLEITANAFRLTGVLGTKEIPFSEVADYSIEAHGLTQAIKLLDSSGRCLGRIHNHLADFAAILTWVEEEMS
jgi:hypothetical protein